MEKPKLSDNFLLNRWESMRYAFKGFFYLIRAEKAIQVHFSLTLIFIVLGFAFRLTFHEWLFQVLAFGLILSIEGLNTAIEELCDFIHPEFHHRIGKIKDISAGAVTFAALSGYSSVLIIYITKIFNFVLYSFNPTSLIFLYF